MKKPRISTLIILIQFVVIVICFGFLARALWLNHFFKLRSTGLASNLGMSQAREDFVRGRLWLYQITLCNYDAANSDAANSTTLDCVSEPTGRHEGPFEIRTWPVKRYFPVIERQIQQSFVEDYNLRMRQLYEKPEWFDKNGFRVLSHKTQINTSEIISNK